MDDKKDTYQLIKTMTKFEKETRYQLYVFIKTTVYSAKCETTAPAHDAFFPLIRHDVLTVPLTVLVHCQIPGMMRMLSSCAQIGRLLITKHVREFFYSFDLKNITRIFVEKGRIAKIRMFYAPSQIYSG